jgi:quinolinate synthase
MTAEAIYLDLKDKLSRVVPDFELRHKADLAAEILELKKRRNAVILAHNYMEPALFYSVPDHRGDSLELSRIAASTDADVIVFCGVRFMAETAKILSPDKTVLFLPDEYLARNVARETGKRILFPSVAGAIDEVDPGSGDGAGTMIGWRGRCEVHEQFSVEDVENVREQFPDVLILAHPECSPEVVDASDYSASTSKMIRYVEDSAAPQYLLLTECSMADNIAAANPDKEMLGL